MKVNTFVKKFKEDEFKNEKDMFKTEYIPVKEKHDIAMRVIALCTENDNGLVLLNKFNENIYFPMFMFNAYTGVEISEDFDALVGEYDKLCSVGVFDVLKVTCARDCSRAEEILSFEEQRLKYQNSIEASFAQIANGINTSLTTLSDSLAGKIDDFDINSILPEGADINELLSTLDKLK